MIVRIFKILSSIILILFLLINVHSAFAASQEIVAVAIEDWPVHYVAGEDGNEVKGFAIDVMNKVAQKTSINLRYIVTKNWAEANKISEKYETVIFPSMGITDDRLELYDFSEPYDTMHIRIFVRSTDGSINSVSDLLGKKVGAVETNVGVNIVKKIEGVHYIVYESLEEVFMSLLSGNIDAIIYPEQPLINMAVLAGLEDKVRGAGKPIKEVKRAIAIKNGSASLVNDINVSLQELIASPEFEDIYKRWYSKPEPYWNIKRLLVLMLAVIGAVLIIVIFWRHKLLLNTQRIQNKTIEAMERTQEALNSSEAFMRNLLESIPDLIWLKDRNGVYLTCNRRFEKFFGAKASEIAGKTDYDFVDKELADFFRSHDRKAMELGKPTINEERLIFSDGYHGVFETIKTPIQGTDGRLIGILGIARDITTRKNAEEVLRTNERRYISAQRMGKVGNWEYDLVTETFWGSDQAKRIYGFDPEKDRFTTEDVENCIPKRERVHQALIDLIEKGTPYNIEFDIQPISGSGTRTVRSVAEIVRDETGSPLNVSGVIQDITEQREAEEEKIKLAKQLKQSQKMESIGLLAGGIAHDFNNILSVIIGFTQLALSDVEKNSPIEDDLQQIYTASQRAKELVAQVLAFARQSEEEIKPVRVDLIIKEALQLIRATIPTSIEIKTDIHSKSLIMGNHTQLHQIVMNLCTNAAHAMEEKDGILQVSLKDTVIDRHFDNEQLDLNYGDYINISFSDTGIGIPSDNLNSIFEPYFSTKKVGEGTGMGLAMVHGIVESYGGKILVESKSGKGATFEIYLPVTGKSDFHRQQESKPLPTGTERILVVDDEAPIAKMLAQNLKRLGYTVTSKTSSLEALELFQTKPNDFDLIVTDMAMPNLTGDALAIKLMRIRQDIPIILCTGYSKKISDKTASQIGIKAFVYKPILQADFVKTVRKVLDEVND